jgi:hypothetical protein
MLSTHKIIPQVFVAKGTLLPYHGTIDNDDNSIPSLDSFHSIEDDEERDSNQSTQDNMILFDSIVKLNTKYICDIPILNPNFTNLRASHKSFQQFS